MSNDNIGAAFEDRFHELISFVEEALHKVQEDEMPDLSDLDGRVSNLCRDVESAGQEAAESVQPLMADMITKLDELAMVLTEYQQKAQETPDKP